MISLLWLFPILYLFFGAENMWWVCSLIVIGATIVFSTDLIHIHNWVEQQTHIDPPNYIYYPTDCGGKDD